MHERRWLRVLAILIVNGVGAVYAPNCYIQPDGEWCFGATYLGDQGSLYGSLYKVRPDGSGLTTIYSFDIVHGWAPGPSPILDPSGTQLYGTTTQGGLNGSGVVYAYSLVDQKISTLATFAGPSGSCSWSHMLLGNTLYGKAGQGGAYGYGTVWAVDVSGSSALKVLHDFGGTPSDVATGRGTDCAHRAPRRRELSLRSEGSRWIPPADSSMGRDGWVARITLGCCSHSIRRMTRSPRSYH